MSRLRALCLLGCSQQEGVATCLHSVLQQPSCGPTLVDFSEITWHPDCGWLQGDCCLCSTLLWSALASSLRCLYHLPSPKSVSVWTHEEPLQRTAFQFLSSIRKIFLLRPKANKRLSFYFYFEDLPYSLEKALTSKSTLHFFVPVFTNNVQQTKARSQGFLGCWMDRKQHLTKNSKWDVSLALMRSGSKDKKYNYNNVWTWLMFWYFIYNALAIVCVPFYYV